jgi:hypothetical protein
VPKSTLVTLVDVACNKQMSHIASQRATPPILTREELSLLRSPVQEAEEVKRREALSSTVFHIWIGISGVLWLVDLLLRYKMLQHRFPRRGLTLLEWLNLGRAGGLTFLTDPTDFDLKGRVYRRWAIRVQAPLLIWFSLGLMIIFVIGQR